MNPYDQLTEQLGLAVGEIIKLRAALATVTAERDQLGSERFDAEVLAESRRLELATERAAHEETKRERDMLSAGFDDLHEGQLGLERDLEATRAALADMTQLRQKAEQYGLKQDAALAKAEARVKELESVRRLDAEGPVW